MPIITKKQGTLEYLTAGGISVPHGFTTRLGGVSTGTQSSLNLAVGRGDSMENVEQNLRILSRAIGFDPDKLVMTLQIHSSIVRVVTDADHVSFCHRDYPKCDALVTNTPGVALLVFTADCTPLLFHDPVTGAVGAAHAGWRGTAQAIGAKVVRAMADAFGSKPENIHAAIGPNIGVCHFETDADVPEAMRAAFGSQVDAFIEKRGEKFHLDLKQINALVLRRSGVEHIEISDACTCCSTDRFWSHRATRGERGSQGAVIVCREVAE
ncbi:MAG: peptidoglycan editing factor PgeF [Faecousia sp.]